MDKNNDKDADAVSVEFDGTYKDENGRIIPARVTVGYVPINSDECPPDIKAQLSETMQKHILSLAKASLEKRAKEKELQMDVDKEREMFSRMLKPEFAYKCLDGKTAYTKMLVVLTKCDRCGKYMFPWWAKNRMPNPQQWHEKVKEENFTFDYCHTMKGKRICEDCADIVVMECYICHKPTAKDDVVDIYPETCFCRNCYKTTPAEEWNRLQEEVCDSRYGKTED